MKGSRFNVLTRAQDDPTTYLLYNTLHDHRILFDDPELNPRRLLAKLKKNEPLNPKETETAEVLYEMGVLIDDDTDENKIFKEWYLEKIQERTDYMQITILPTMKCNLACDYCFENDVREYERLTPERTEQLIRFLKARVKTVRPKTFHITFFGGEPLTHPEAVKDISRQMWEYCENFPDVTMEIGMITNGVFLTPEFVDALLPYGFEWVKITFDGDRDEHDKKRIWHNGRGTFDTIYDNLSRIAGKLKIAIGGNFDQANYESMFSLIERLRSSPFADDIFIARFKPIIDVQPDIALKREGGRLTDACNVCTYNNEQINQMQRLRQKTFESGLPIEDRPVVGPCEFHQHHSMTIGPNGLIYKCPAFVGLHNLAAGDIYHDEFNQYGEWQHTFTKWDSECEECAYLPNCAGGCRFNAVNTTGSLEPKSCELNLLVKSTENFMQREIVKMRADGEKEEILPVYSAA